jgi:hypothetical protein
MATSLQGKRRGRTKGQEVEEGIVSRKRAWNKNLVITITKSFLALHRVILKTFSDNFSRSYE